MITIKARGEVRKTKKDGRLFRSIFVKNPYVEGTTLKTDSYYNVVVPKDDKIDCKDKEGKYFVTITCEGVEEAKEGDYMKLFAKKVSKVELEKVNG